jgi:hypothetical protein
MNMKVLSKSILFIALISSTLFSACGKYEDGPKFSLASKKSRLAGDWKIEKFLFNSSDQTATYLASVGNDFKMDIEKSGSYKITGSPMVADEGSWKLGEDKDDITFNSSIYTSSSADTYRILRLKSKELWWKQTQPNGDVWETHFVPAD